MLEGQEYISTGKGEPPPIGNNYKLQKKASIAHLGTQEHEQKLIDFGRKSKVRGSKLAQSGFPGLYV